MASGFLSEAQRTKWRQLVSDGKVTQRQFYLRESASAKNLPSRATPRHRTVGASRAPAEATFNNRRY